MTVYNFTVRATDSLGRVATSPQSVEVYEVDPLWDDVVSLLNFENDFTDAKGVVWTPNGNVYVGAQGAVFDGNGDFLSTGSDSRFGFGTGAFCVDAIFSSTVSNMVMFDQRTTDHHGVFLVNQAPGQLGNDSIAYYGTPGGTRAGAAGHATNDGEQHHYAWSRDAEGVFRQFVNGIKTYEASLTNDFASSRPGRIGAAFNNAAYFNGLVRAHRVTKGVPRYTTDFVPPTWPLPTH